MRCHILIGTEPNEVRYNDLRYLFSCVRLCAISVCGVLAISQHFHNAPLRLTWYQHAISGQSPHEFPANERNVVCTFSM